MKWSNTLKKFVGKLSTNCLSMFDHFGGMALKGLKIKRMISLQWKNPCNCLRFSAREIVFVYYFKRLLNNKFSH